MAGEQTDRRTRVPFRNLYGIAVRNTLLIMLCATIAVMLTGGFETRANFFLFLLFCVLFTFPFTLVCEYFWPSRRS